MASTGSGKSTLAAALVEDYMRRHPAHQLIILDPKDRFEPTGLELAGGPVFPDGPHERIIGRRRAVRVQGHYWRFPRLLRPQHQVSIWSRDMGSPDLLFDHLFENAHIRRPLLVFADETINLFGNGGRATLPFRRLMQMGRALGIGMLLVNQRPKWIDGTLASDTENLYVGRLGNQADFAHIRKELTPTTVAKQMTTEMDHLKWFYVDRVRPARSRPFELEAA